MVLIWYIALVIEKRGGYFNVFSSRPPPFLAKLWPHGRYAEKIFSQLIITTHLGTAHLMFIISNLSDK